MIFYILLVTSALVLRAGTEALGIAPCGALHLIIMIAWSLFGAALMAYQEFGFTGIYTP